MTCKTILSILAFLSMASGARAAPGPVELCIDAGSPKPLRLDRSAVYASMQGEARNTEILRHILAAHGWKWIQDVGQSRSELSVSGGPFGSIGPRRAEATWRMRLKMMTADDKTTVYTYLHLSAPPENNEETAAAILERLVQELERPGSLPICNRSGQGEPSQ